MIFFFHTICYISLLFENIQKPISRKRENFKGVKTKNHKFVNFLQEQISTLRTQINASNL